MNRKIISTSIITSLVMLSTVFAGILGVTNANVDVNSETKTTIDNIGVGEIQITELMCDTTNCRASMYKWIDVNQTRKYGLGSIDIPARYCSREGVDKNNATICMDYTDYTQEELTTARDLAIKDKLEQVSSVINERSGRSITEKVGNGEVTLS